MGPRVLQDQYKQKKSPIARRDQKRQKSYSSSVSQKGGARESKEVICWQQPGGPAVFLLRIKVSLPAFQAVFPLLLPSAARSG